MGCVSSTLIGHDEDFPQIGGSTAFGHHIVSLTSTTYGLLTLDHQPPPPPSSSSSSSNLSAITATHDTPPPPPLKPDQIINSWELMAGLDSTTPVPTPDPSFRFSISPLTTIDEKENSNRNSFATPIDHHVMVKSSKNANDLAAEDAVISTMCPSPSAADRRRRKYSLDEFEKICPPNGEDRVVIYTTTLRGVRKTYEACNAVRSAVEGFGVSICERDISLDRGFREELRELLKKKKQQLGTNDEMSSVLIPPRVFIKGRYIGGAEEVMRIVDQGGLQDLLQGLPKLKKAAGYVCDGCGGARFLPCFNCNGSCKIVMVVKSDMDTPLNLQQRRRKVVVLKCSQCNENGLVLCPICT